MQQKWTLFLAISCLLMRIPPGAEANFKILWSHKYRSLPPYIGDEGYSQSDLVGFSELYQRMVSEGHHDLGRMTYEQWEEYIREDGFLCRTHRDCDWIEPKLYCQNYKVDLERPWFSQEVGSHVDGYCSCPTQFVWDEEITACREHTVLERWFNLLLVVGLLLLVVGISYLAAYFR